MRDLNITDAFRLSKIIDKMEIRFDIDNLMNQMQSVMANNGVEKAQAFLGGQMVLTLVSKMYKAEDEVIEWIASLTDKSVDEVKKFNLKELKAVLTELFNSDGFVELFQ